MDVDECGFVATPCGTPLAACTNKPGGYECTCPRGYSGGGPLGIGCSPRVVAGYAATCVLPESGGVQCWGGDAAGVWHEEYPDAASPRPEPLRNADDAVSVAMGNQHACILRKNGTVGCWGHNEEGQVGDGDKKPRPWAFDVAGLEGVVSIGAGVSHTCAVLRDGRLRCWGANDAGQLGDGTTEERRQPVAVKLGPVAAVGPSANHTCALLRDGTVSCWGANYSGQLGTATRTGPKEYTPPVQVPGLTDAIGLTSSSALRRDGTVVWWGEDRVHMRMFEDEVTGVELRGPTLMQGITDAVAIDGSGETVCALRRNASVWCRGVGALGNGKDGPSAVPVKVADVDDALSLSLSGHGCVLATGGSVKCWGPNWFKVLGNDSSRKSLKPRTVPRVAVLESDRPR